VWNAGPRVAQLANPGDYVTYELGKESFLFVRQEDGSIACFYNVCRHRGNRLCRELTGHAKSFLCASHHWRWDINGRIKNIPDRNSFSKLVMLESGLRLEEVRCESWAGWVCMRDRLGAGVLTCRTI
jgi:phenylpropionate dioxygenase-like ring-hydroxylating dioxygenase large terminal subunit